MKKRMIALLLALVMLLGLAACAAKEEPAENPTPAETEAPAEEKEEKTEEPATEEPATSDTEVEYTIQWYVGTSAIQDGSADFVRQKFTEKYPQYDINIIEMDGTDTQQQLLTMISAGECVDCVWDEAGNIVAGGIAGTYLDLSEYFKADGRDYEDEFGSLAAQVASGSNGEIYGIPKYYNTFKVFYNKSMLEDAGVEIPEDGCWSWDEFVAAAHAVNDPDNGVYGCVWPSTWCDTITCMAACTGWDYAKVDDAGNVSPNFDDPRLEDAMTKVRDLADVEGVTPSMSTIRAESLNRRVYFATQQTAMIVDGPFTFQWMKNYMFNDPGEGPLEFEVGVAEVPYLEGGENCSFANVVGLWGVPKTSGNPEAAYHFIHFIETEDWEVAARNTAYLSCYTKWEEQGISYSDLNYEVFSNNYVDIDGETHNDIYTHELVDQLTTIPKEFHQVYWDFNMDLSNADSQLYALYDEQLALFMNGEMEFDEWAEMINGLGAEQLAAAGLDKLG